MKVVVVHERYIQPGGEDQVFEAECALLESHGHDVVRYEENNERIPEMSRVSVGMGTVWNPRSRRAIRDLLRAERPGVVHFHNTLPLISPAAYHAAADVGVPVVQTLHNYRLVCPKGVLFREGRPCEKCVGKTIAWPSVVHACYRGSRAGSGAIAAMLGVHRALGTWSEKVHRYIALTDFARGRFVEGGLPEERIRVKPNFLAPDPGAGEHAGDHALFVGRLSEEKGVADLLAAWERVGDRMPLWIVGDGPESDQVAAAAERLPGVEWLGRRDHDEVVERMKRARALVFPSRWYEGHPLVLIEAFATGLPVLASDLGAMRSLVTDGVTGLRFRSGDAEDLARVVEWVIEHPGETDAMGRRARSEYLAEHTAARAYDRLLEIYEEAREEAGVSSGATPTIGASG